MSARLNLAGMRFGRWQALEYVDAGKWLCLCDCGTKKLVAGSGLRGGGTYSCGCRRVDLKIKHGHNRKPGGKRDRSSAYSRWSAMWQRCENPKYKQFADYGGRGITVCERWRDFAAFLEDMGEPPEGMTLDRIDNSRGYEPANCRWVTRSEQQMNKRNNRLLEKDGVSMPVTAWARKLGMKPNTIRSRLRYGWTVDRVLTVS